MKTWTYHNVLQYKIANNISSLRPLFSRSSKIKTNFVDVHERSLRYFQSKKNCSIRMYQPESFLQNSKFSFLYLHIIVKKSKILVTTIYSKIYIILNQPVTLYNLEVSIISCPIPIHKFRYSKCSVRSWICVTMCTR